MDKKEVIARFCALASKVGEERFSHQYAHDCFCSEQDRFDWFQFEFEIMKFIEEAVEKHLREQGKAPNRWSENT